MPTRIEVSLKVFYIVGNNLEDVDINSYVRFLLEVIENQSDFKIYEIKSKRVQTVNFSIKKDHPHRDDDGIIQSPRWGTKEVPIIISWSEWSKTRELTEGINYNHLHYWVNEINGRFEYCVKNRYGPKCDRKGPQQILKDIPQA